MKSQLVAQFLDAMETVGVDRRELLSAVGLDEARVRDPRAPIPWSSFTTMIDLAWHKLGGDVERMRLAGRAIARAPSYVLLHRLARAVVSVEQLYVLASRWGTRASIPHISLACEEVSPRRLRFRGAIPEPHAPSTALHHLFEGTLVELPTLLGLPPATIVSSRVTPRTLDVVLELPVAPSRRERLRRTVRAALGAPEVLELLEQQRRVLEESLVEAQRSTAENRELLDRLPDFVMIHRDGVLLWLNRANVQALGYESVDDLVGRPLLDLVEPASRETIRARMRTPIGSSAPGSSEIRLVTRSGRVIVTEISPAQTVTFEGKPARLIVGRDVTERIRMQEQLRLADRMASVGVLTAGVAHEVNNPLAYVLHNIEHAKRDLARLGEPTSEARAMLGVALEGVDRIRLIVRDLLALSRVDDVMGPVDLGAVVDSTLKLARVHVEREASLEVVREPTPKVRGNVARLGQVVLNLVTNAVQSMPPRPRQQNLVQVLVRPSPSGGALLEVRDNGVGVAPENAARIFDPFFTTKSSGRGTGLGLAICQRIVAEMGGEISFESRPNEGTTFRVALTAWESAEKPGATQPSA